MCSAASPPSAGARGRPRSVRCGCSRRPGPIYEPEGAGTDYWRMARALFAAGFRAGDLVHNSFSYHFTPAGAMMESGAFALGCTVFPAGTGQTEQQVQAMADLEAGRLHRHAELPEDHAREGGRELAWRCPR